MFDEFWRATGESPFDELITTCPECYRLSIRSARADHQVIRMQRSHIGTSEASRLVTHFFVWDPAKTSSAKTNEIALDEEHWHAMDALLAVAKYWELTESSRGGLDGSTYTLEAWKNGRKHAVSRWSPSAIIPGGELFAVVTDYLHRLAELASFECELYERYAPDYVPKRRLPPRGNLA